MVLFVLLRWLFLALLIYLAVRAVVNLVRAVRREDAPPAHRRHRVAPPEPRERSGIPPRPAAPARREPDIEDGRWTDLD